MRLITAEDYAKLHKMKLQDVYRLIDEQQLKSMKSPIYDRITLVYVDHAPKSISSLSPEIEYLSQTVTATKMGITTHNLRQKLKAGEVKSVLIKGKRFISVNELPSNKND